MQNTSKHKTEAEQVPHSGLAGDLATWMVVGRV